MNHTYILIMAGGEGTRFAPLSTPERPKQFLNLVGQDTFIQQTYRRALRLVPPGQIFVATNERHIPIVREQLPEIPKENLIGEPLKKNTAPALAYAAGLIHEHDASATMICLPSDHHILNEDGFALVLSRAVSLARDGYLVTLGMKPTWGSPEYGYICPKEKDNNWSVVNKFVEKPDCVTAEKYLREGFLWNGGIFAWQTKIFLDEVKKYAPELYPANAKLNYFSSIPSISIDYALMEKTDKVAVIPCDVGWSDVGTWEGLYRLHMQDGVLVAPEAVRVMNQALLPRRVEKPWGHEEIWAHTNDYVGKVIFINKPHRLSYQYHRIKEETIRVLEGIMELEWEAGSERKTVRLKSGDTFHIPPETKHRMIAVEDCRVLEVSTPHLSDVVRIEDDYGRKG